LQRALFESLEQGAVAHGIDVEAMFESIEQPPGEELKPLRVKIWGRL
jgi:hypothetical protein